MPVATNWAADDPLLELPPARTIEVPAGDGTLRIAFVGILDPSLQDLHGGLSADGVEISDPIESVQPVVAELASQTPPPDAIVALTTASGAVQDRIRRELRGVDLLIGDPTLATYRTPERTVELRRIGVTRKGAAVTLPLEGLAVAELSFSADDAHLDRVQTRPVLVPVDAPVDPESTAAITRVRAEHLPAQEAVLLGPASAEKESSATARPSRGRVTAAPFRATPIRRSSTVRSGVR